MSQKHWEELYEDLKILINPKLMPIAKPTAADFAKFESKTGFLLPASFKDYMLVFGPGVLAKEFFIVGPNCKQSNADLLDLNEARFSQASPGETVWSPFQKSA